MLIYPSAYRSLRLRSGTGQSLLAEPSRSRCFPIGGGQPLVPLPLEQTQPGYLAPPKVNPDRRIRHILIGQRDIVRSTITQLHALGYVETFQWNRVLPVPENGIVITPDQGEAFSFLLRQVSFEG